MLSIGGGYSWTSSSMTGHGGAHRRGRRGGGGRGRGRERGRGHGCEEEGREGCHAEAAREAQSGLLRAIVLYS
jgi:hypothetical protein